MARSFEGSILRIKNGSGWYARLRYTDRAGRRREKKRTCISHAKAKAEIQNLKLEVEAESRDRKTYRELDVFFRKHYVHAAKFVNGQKISGFRQKIVAVEHYLDAPLAFFGDRPIEQISYADLRDLKTNIVNTPVMRPGPPDANGNPTRISCPRSIADTNHFLKRLRRLFNIAIEQGWLDTNPFKRGGPLITESFEVERTRTLSHAEETRLLAACDGRRSHLRPLIVFAVETAMRRGEIRTLRWASVNLTGRFIKIDATNTKTLKSRLVPISARLRETLAELRQNQLRPNSPVFGMSDFKRSFAGACRDAGLTDVHFHDLRHTAITRMLEKGISQPLVMKISGHSQMKTFLRYVNQSEQSVYDIALKLDAA